MTNQKITTLEQLAYEMMKKCEEDGFAFQCFDDEHQARFCYWSFNRDVMLFCPYVDSKTFVRVKGRNHYLCNAEMKDIA